MAHDFPYLFLEDLRSNIGKIAGFLEDLRSILVSSKQNRLRVLVDLGGELKVPSKKSEAHISRSKGIKRKKQDYSYTSF